MLFNDSGYRHAVTHARGGPDPLTTADIALQGANGEYGDLYTIPDTCSVEYGPSTLHTPYSEGLTPGYGTGLCHVLVSDSHRALLALAGDGQLFVNRLPFGATDWSGWRRVLHEADQPMGSYTGNGSSANRTIDTGGRGNVALIHSANGTAILTSSSGLHFTGTSVSGLSLVNGKVVDGVITLATTQARLNAADIVYYYQLL